MVRYAKLTDLDIEWVGKWARKVNDDKVLKVIGRFFNANFVIGVDDNDYYIQVRNGKIELVTNELHANQMGWQFALRASSGTWNKFIEPLPPPMFNDIWAMAHPLHQNLKIEGDTLVFWQNLRALTWMLAVMRQV